MKIIYVYETYMQESQFTQDTYNVSIDEIFQFGLISLL
jgi:hypothetical protein